MTTNLHDKQSLDAWWASLPTIDDHLTDTAMRDEKALEDELLGMSDISRLQGKARKQFVRKLSPIVELTVRNWGDVVRRLKGSYLAKAISQDGREWLTKVEVAALAIIRNPGGKEGNRVEFDRRLAAIISRDAVRNVLEAEGVVTPDQLMKDLAGLFDVMSRETRSIYGPDTTFKTEPVTLELTMDEDGGIEKTSPDEASSEVDMHALLQEYVANEIAAMWVSPVPTIMPLANGGVILVKSDFSLPLRSSSIHKFAAVAWVSEPQMTARMREIRDLWQDHLSGNGLTDWVFDTNDFAALTLKGPLP